MNKTYDINDAVRAYREALSLLEQSPNLFTLIGAIKSALDANVGLGKVLDLAQPVPARRYCLGELKFPTPLSNSYSWAEFRRLESLSRISTLVSISEALWQLLEPWNLEEVWSDEKCLYSVRQFVKYSIFDAPGSLPSTLSSEQRSAAREAGYMWAKADEELRSESKRLSDAARSEGYPYVPWAIFVKEFLVDEPGFSVDLADFSSLVATYYQPQPNAVRKSLREEDRLAFCKLYGGLMRIVLYENLRAPIGEGDTLENFIHPTVGIRDLHATAATDSSISIFDCFLCIQNLLILSACLDVDPLDHGLVTESEFKREHFEDYTATPLQDEIIVPSIFLELVFLPPTAANRVFQVWTPYEGKKFDALPVLRWANFGVIADRLDDDRFLHSLTEHLCYFNDDEEALQFLSPMLERLQTLVGSWVFPLQTLDKLDQHCERRLLDDIDVQANIKEALRSQEVHCEFEDFLPSSWLEGEYPPILEITEQMHPALAVLPSMNAHRCVASRPDEWLAVVETFLNYGFFRAGATLLSLALVAQGKLNRFGFPDPFDHHRLSRIAHSFAPPLFQSKISFALSLYIQLSDERLVLPVRELFLDLIAAEPRLERKTLIRLTKQEPTKRVVEQDGRLRGFSPMPRELLLEVLDQLGDGRYDRIFNASAIVANAAMALENELRIRLGDNWRGDVVRDELLNARIGFNSKNGPEGLKSFANLLRNYQGFTDTTKVALSGLASLALNQRAEEVVAALVTVADISNTRHGNVKDFETSKQVIARADEVRKIFLESDFLTLMNGVDVAS